jgi:hypothetical protein
MKRIQALLGAALCGVIFSLAINASAQSEGSGYATVVRVVGIASYSLGDDIWHPLLAGKYLPVGALIRTGENGVVDVVLGKAVEMPQAAWQPDHISLAPDAPVRGMVDYKPSTEQNVIRLTPDTMLAIDRLTVTDTGADTVSDTELDLRKGKIFASVKKLSGASQYLIKLPSGIAGVRGTKFSISADGTTVVFESTGGGVVLSLVLPNGSTQTFVVTPGQSFDTTTDQLSAIQADLGAQLEDLFKAIQTVYLEIVNFSYDYTQCYVSPTHGAHGGHHGHGGGGQGGNQD